MTGIDLDHTSFAVHDATAWAARLRDELGALVMSQGSLEVFRYTLLYIGDASSGARLELIDPLADGFLTTFLDRHGEGPHHLTFTVPDLPSAVATVRDLGAAITGESYANPEWHEAFLVPDARHRTVIQLAQTPVVYPSREEFVASQRGEGNEGPVARLGATHLGSTDLGFSRSLFGDALGGTPREVGEAVAFDWPSGTVIVHPRDVGGVIGIELEGAERGVAIGGTPLAPRSDGRSAPSRLDHLSD